MSTLTARGAPASGSGMEAHDADFAAYLDARQASLLRTAYLLTGNRADAEDLLQTALAKVYVAWGRIRERGAIDAYVRRAIVNEHNSMWRRAWRRREVSVDEVPDRAAPGGDDLDTERIWGFVSTLPRKQRAVIVLRYYEQLSEAEIAETLGISVGTVKSQASRALAALRDRAPASLDPRPPGRRATPSDEEDPR